MNRSKQLAYAVAFALSVSVNVAQANPPSGSAYFTDTQSSHVEDATSHGIGTVNMIACIMSALKPDVLVNKGNYIALVDEPKCDANGRSSTENTSGDAAQGANYTTAVVNSTRASNSDPMLMKAWLNMSEEGLSTTVYIRSSASQAPTANNPYGVFRLDFCGKQDGIQGPCMMNGFLDAQAGSLNFYEEEGENDRGKTVALRLTSVGTSTGSGRLSTTRSENGSSNTEEFAFAYDQTHFLRGDQCFSRDASDPETGFSVWRYGLYDATTGARVTRNSGFPLEYTTNGNTYRGYMGYWGLSLPPDAPTVTSGTTVNRVDYGNGSGDPTTTAYTLVKSDGKLTKYTRRSTTLDKLDRIKLNTFVGNNASGFFSGAVANTQYELYWDNTASSFKATAQMNCSNSGCQAQPLAPERVVATDYLVSQGGLQGWSQSLGGEVFVRLAGATAPLAAESIAVNYRAQDLVYPNDIPATLYCVNNCPTAASMSAYFAHSGPQSPFAGSTFNNFGQTAAANVVTYNGDSNAAVLRDNTAATVTFTNREALSESPQYQNGVRTGRLFTSLAVAECSTGSGTYCDYKVNDAEVYYQWETGVNNWNQFAAVKDSSNNVVMFDAPLQVSFTVPSGAQYGQYAGTSMVLQYNGFGDLWGIPGQCVSRLTNQPMGCDSEEARYVPEFVIPMSDVTGVVRSGSTNYLVKWLDREIRFARKNANVCSALSAPSNVTLPTSSGLQDTSNPNSSAYIGAQPVITGAPRVIHGDVKY